MHFSDIFIDLFCFDFMENLIKNKCFVVRLQKKWFYCWTLLRRVAFYQRFGLVKCIKWVGFLLKYNFWEKKSWQHKLVSFNVQFLRKKLQNIPFFRKSKNIYLDKSIFCKQFWCCHGSGCWVWYFSFFYFLNCFDCILKFTFQKGFFVKI